jgi:hypothetical protein
MNDLKRVMVLKTMHWTARDELIMQRLKMIDPPVTMQELIKLMKTPFFIADHTQTDILELLETAPENKYIPIVRMGNL